jgi:LuxR family maltose regulon positive regulatory protein
LSELGGRVSYQLAGRIVLARVYLVRGDENRAHRIIQQAERLAQGYDHPFPMAEVAELRARLWMAQGNQAAAARWAEGLDLGPAKAGPALASEVEQIAVARVLLAEGKPGGSLELLAGLLAPAEKAGRMKSANKILALQALALQAQGNLVQALSTLERALSRAAPEGFVRTFVDEGEKMAKLLRRALVEGIAPSYVSKLLAASGESDKPAPEAAQALVEPLTERELEVLRLIAAGLSNQEIALELVVALSTVKTHINHIYGKLDAKSRTQAVAKARELDLA